MKGWAAVRPGVYTDGKRFAVRVTRQANGERKEEPLAIFEALDVAVEFQKVAKMRRRFERDGVAIPVSLRPRETIGGVLDAHARECRALGKSEAHLRSIVQARRYLVGSVPPAKPFRGWRDPDSSAEDLRRELGEPKPPKHKPKNRRKGR